jgi:hypothetical protein
MKYIFIILLFLLHYYLITFAIHNWKNKNKMAALGTFIINVAIIVVQVFLFMVDI